jgi:hypothetical protein
LSDTSWQEVPKKSSPVALREESQTAKTRMMGQFLEMLAALPEQSRFEVNATATTPEFALAVLEHFLLVARDIQLDDATLSSVKTLRAAFLSLSLLP